MHRRASAEELRRQHVDLRSGLGAQASALWPSRAVGQSGRKSAPAAAVPARRAAARCSLVRSKPAEAAQALRNEGLKVSELFDIAPRFVLAPLRKASSTCACAH